MIQFKNLSLTRGQKVLFTEATFQLHPGHRVGLTGANGTGKSSLFALLQGLLQAETGVLDIPARWTIAHVAQETPALPLSALSFTLEGDHELMEIRAAIADAELAQEGTRVAELHQRLHEIDGYSAEARASALLHGLGFTQEDILRPVNAFSGGWRMRLNLARALMCRSDLLLLDEPTNHLDLDTVIWLEDWLKSYQGTLLLISHDRDFLDNVVNHILHIEHQRISLYRGGYSDFERQRIEKLALQQAMFEKQQRKIAHLQSYIDRFRVQATKARQAQSRIKALERMETLTAAHVDSQFTFEFRSPHLLPDSLLVLDHGSAGYDDKVVLQGLQLTIRAGDRIGLLGKNGQGKSTLIKLLADELPLISGKKVEGKSLVVGYFAQHQLEQLRPEDSPLQHLQRLDSEAKEQELLNFLGGFDFQGPMAKSSCQHFSGGEKSRLALAILIWQKPHLLLLDEPTNHLDLEMRHALTLALQNFEGGMVLVSHDRALLRTTCDTFLLVDQGQVQPFDGDLEDYKRLLQTRQSVAPSVANAVVKEIKVNDYQRNKMERQASLAARRPLQKQITALEKQLDALQQEKQTLDQRAGDSDLYEVQNKLELQTLLKRQAELNMLIEAAETEWLLLQEQLELI